MTSAVDLSAIQAADERRRERVQVLRACRPIERRFLKGLAEAAYSPYTAARQIGISDSTAWKMMQRARVKKAMQLFLEDALDRIGVSHASLVADLVKIKERCMQCQPVLDDEGKPTGMFQFDARAAIAAVKEIADLLEFAPAKRIELSGAVQMQHTSEIPDEVDQVEAARIYQEFVRRH